MKRVVCALLVFVLLLSMVACGGTAENDVPEKRLSGNIVKISKYGNITLSTTKEDMAKNGFEFGDIVTVSFAKESIDIPYCSTYSDVDAGVAGLFGRYDDETVTLAVNVGNFATIYNIADKTTQEDQSFEWVYREGIDETLVFAITMKQKRGYYSEFVLRQLSYSDEREDYPELSDEQFGNFRVVTTTGIGENILYRSATPVDPQKNRNAFVDAAARHYGITVIVDLNDSEAALNEFEGFASTYFATTEYIALNMGLDFTEIDFKNKLKDGLKYMCEHKGVYLVHCLEGKDRTGFVIALLEFLMGATYEEAEDDYMITYYNYYGVKKGDEKYNIIATSNFEKNLLRTFDVTDVKNTDLARLSTEYIKSIGLTDIEIATLKANLTNSDKTNP